MTEKRECPNSKTEIIDSRDKHWDTNLVCAKCCANAKIVALAEKVENDEKIGDKNQEICHFP